MAQTIDVTQILKEPDGSDIQDQGTPVTLRVILANAIRALPQASHPEVPGQRRRLTTEEKERRFQLSNLIWKTKQVKLDSDDVTDLLKLVRELYEDPIVCGRVKQLLEGEEQTVPTDAEDSPSETAGDAADTSN